MSNATMEEAIAFLKANDRERNYDRDAAAVSTVVRDGEWHSIADFIDASGVPERTLRRKMPDWRWLVTVKKGKRHYYKLATGVPTRMPGEGEPEPEQPEYRGFVAEASPRSKKRLEAVVEMLSDGEWHTSREMIQASGLKDQRSVRKNMDRGWEWPRGPVEMAHKGAALVYRLHP